MIVKRLMIILWILVFGILYLIHGSEACIGALLLALIYVIASGISVRVCGRRLKAAFQGGGFGEKDQDIPLTLMLKNESRLPVPRLSLTLQGTNRLTGEVQQIPVILSLGPKGKREEGVTVRDACCGTLRVTVESARVQDGLGLFARKVEIPGIGDGVIMPTMETLSIPQDFLDSYNMESYTYSHSQSGEDSGEVYGIREYQEGDSPKSIHWKLSAKMDDLVVKIPSFPIENNLILLLDNSLEDSVTMKPQDYSSLLDLYASLSKTLINQGVRHSLGWYDGENHLFETREIAGTKDLWDVLPAVLATPFSRDGVSTVVKFLSVAHQREFNNHFLVTAGEGLDTQSLEKYGAVKIFRSKAQ